MPGNEGKEEGPAADAEAGAETGKESAKEAEGAVEGKGAGREKGEKKGKKAKVAKGKRIRKKKQKKIKGKYYEVSGETLKRGRRSCPRCGSGVFMAEHKDRYACGRCSYTDWKQAGRNLEGSKQEERLGEGNGPSGKHEEGAAKAGGTESAKQ